MVKAPDSLVWELVKDNTCFMKKRNGRTKRSGAVRFSVEKGNLKNLSQFKYSGLANSKSVDVVCTEEHGAELITKTASKAHSYPKKGFATTPINKHFARVAKVVEGQTAGNFYRRDLKDAALGKWTKVYEANRRAKNVTKSIPVKKGRGSI